MLDQVQRPSFIDQLVESYIADIVLFLMEVLGPKRAEQFKRTHLQISPVAAQTLYATPGKEFAADNDMLGGSVNPRYQTVYGKLGKPSKLQHSPKLSGTKFEVATSGSDDIYNNMSLQLPNIEMTRNSERSIKKGKLKPITTVPIIDSLGN